MQLVTALERRAVFGFDDTCRLVLERVQARQFGPVSRTAAWLMCNPSKASHEIDDPTAGRVVHHSARAGCDRSLVGNVWPVRATDPLDLWRWLRVADFDLQDRVAAANLDALAMMGAQADIHVVAYGAEPGRNFPMAVADALEAFSCGGRFPLYCLGTTADNMPLHPLARGKLAVRNDTDLRPWKR